MSKLATVLAAVATFLLVLVAVPRSALARSFSVDEVSIEATVRDDGSLSVVEQRTYTFDGSFNGIYWDVPRGSYEGHDIDSSIRWVGVIEGGSLTRIEEGSGGAAGTYEVSEEGDRLRLTVYWPASDEAVVFQVAYEMPNLALRWADVAELYWQYVPADEGSGDEWKNISCTIHLPVPAGVEVVGGENVRAWGHGPLDGYVGFNDNDVVLFSPGVGSAEFLEARVTFPAEWLGSARQSSEARLDHILSEESQWVEEANNARRSARMVNYGVPGAMALMGVGSVVATFVQKRLAKLKGPKPQFTDTYFRDVPTDDHPAVLGMLYREGVINSNDFSATIMRLADQGRIALDAVWVDKPGRHGSTKRVREWRFLRRDTVGSKLARPRVKGKAIDDAAVSFLFDVVGDAHKHVIDQMLLGPSGEPYVLPSFFDEVAKKWPSAYEAGSDRWRKAVRDAYKGRHFEVGEESTNLFPGLIGFADIGIAIVLGLFGAFSGVSNVPLVVTLILCFAAGIFCIMQFDDDPAPAYSQEAVDIKAKLEALKRWLIDFTRLKEAIPTDVVLWNRLLVMATVLGVAKQVVEQLKVALPELVENPAFSAYGWVERNNELDAPAFALASSYGKGSSTSSGKLHHGVSTSSLSSSSDSSSSGSGGGFSGGGGGGFSGGGRGGAF